MKKYENYRSVLDNRPVRFFDSAEDVWFWFCFCESMPKSSCKGDGLTVRPCETSDVARVIKKLVQEKRLSQEHLKVLSFYGLKQLIPYEKCGDPIRHCSLWRQAVDILTKAFCEKGFLCKENKAIAV